MAVSLYRNTPRVMMLVTAAGFAFLLLELVLMGHTAFAKLYGAIAAGVGLVLSLIGLANSAGLRRILPVLFLVLSLSGIYGTVVHGGARTDRAETATKVQTDDRNVRRALRGFSAMPPTLGPLMLSGLSLLGAMAALVAAGEAAAVVERRGATSMA
jgi:hypothetical protein